MTTNPTPTKPSLETCAELILAARTLTEITRAYDAAFKHYTYTDLTAEVRRLAKIHQ